MDRSEEYMEKLLLSPEEAAHALGVGRPRVYDLMRISGEDGWCLDVVGVRTVAGEAQPFAARQARGFE
jgi:hypothetical protein